MDNIIDKNWLEYLDEVIPKEAPQIQIRESKKAFYAGMASMFDIVTIEMPKIKDDHECEKYLSQIDDELHAYLDRLQKGEE